MDSTENIARKLDAHNVFFIAKRPSTEPGVELLYFSAKTLSGCLLLVELTFRSGFNMCKATTRSPDLSWVPFLDQSLESILRS
eukprot:tig00020592_g11672.t1